MPQITIIRVTRKRSIQPEQFGNATAEVEFVGNVFEGENHKDVARQLLVDSRALVYENLGLRLPKSVVDSAKEIDTPEETVKIEVKVQSKPDTKTDDVPETDKPIRGRPKGSKSTTAKQKKTVDDDIPSDDGEVEPNIRANPEDRRDPNDTDDIPGDDKPIETSAGENDTSGEDFTTEDLHRHINDSIKNGELTVKQAKQMQSEMKVARVRDLDTPAKIAKAKIMIDSFIKANKAK
jgi:hypothetical protein